MAETYLFSSCVANEFAAAIIDTRRFGDGDHVEWQIRRSRERRQCKIAVARRAEGLGVALSPNAASEEIAILLPHDILGRAATLEFREGLTRRDAEFQALAEFGGGQR